MAPTKRLGPGDAAVGATAAAPGPVLGRPGTWSRREKARRETGRFALVAERLAGSARPAEADLRIEGVEVDG